MKDFKKMIKDTVLNFAVCSAVEEEKRLKDVGMKAWVNIWACPEAVLAAVDEKDKVQWRHGLGFCRVM